MHPQVEILLSRKYEEQRSEEWFKLRRGMLTASDAATALGENPYEKPDALVLKKCGLGKKFTGNAATQWGQKYEDEARDIYCAKYNEVVHEIGVCPHPVHKFLGGSPDGISETGKLVEIKCPLRREIKPEVPSYYMPQLQLCMEILDLDEAVFIQYKPEALTWPKPAEFVLVNVKRDRQWFEEKLPIMRAFWDRVLWHREHGCDDLLPKPRKKGRTITIDDLEDEPSCEIEDDSEDEED